jgi:tetratricopeptide (TPR) repeat protein
MGIESLSNWLRLAAQTTSPLALTLVQLRAGQIGGLMDDEDSGLPRRLCAPKVPEVLEGLRELRTRVEGGDDALVSRLERRIEEKRGLNVELAQDAARLRYLLAGGDARPLRGAVASMAASFNQLGENHHRQGRLDAAEHFYLRSLSFAEASLNADHAFFRLVLNNLAAIHFSRGELDHAEFLCRRALKITEKVFGKDHADYARCLVNLVDIYAARGEAKVARGFLRRALPILKQALGADHPEVIKISKRDV